MKTWTPPITSLMADKAITQDSRGLIILHLLQSMYVLDDSHILWY